MSDSMNKRQKIVIPAKAGIQINSKRMDSCFHRNDKFFVLYCQPILVVLIFVLFYPFTSIQSQTDPAAEWHLLHLKIRDSLISKTEAQIKLKELEPVLKDHYLKNWNRKPDDRLVFPLKGYDPRAIGGKGGSGYQPEGYDFFDGNQHKGHPGHDIFIQDKNQDGLDDITGRTVDVISVSSGMVVSVNLNWEPSSPIRGGNYIWIYEPTKSRYYYYAHLNEIYVNVGQIVSKGDRLGTVGRTGVKAYPKSSPTHLHFVVHHSIDGYPKPVNPYFELIRATND
jgi:murein DD-endopeptidase MepM/ murein hydrolase activator NlpD